MSPPLDMPIAISANFLRFELVINLTQRILDTKSRRVFSYARTRRSNRLIDVAVWHIADVIE